MLILLGLAATVMGFVAGEWVGVAVGIGLTGFALFMLTRQVDRNARSNSAYMAMVALSATVAVAVVGWAAYNATDWATRVVALVVLAAVVIGSIYFVLSVRSSKKSALPG
jgi:nitrate reductase gamma subunit